MKRTILLILFLSILSALLAGCMAITAFEVYEGPMQNGVRQPLSVQVTLLAELGDIIVVSWGDGAESVWGSEVYAQRANIRHTYNTEGIYVISVSRDGEGIGYRRVLIEEEK